MSVKKSKDVKRAVLPMMMMMMMMMTTMMMMFYHLKTAVYSKHILRLVYQVW
jgi:hypothetical protein